MYRALFRLVKSRIPKISDTEMIALPVSYTHLTLPTIYSV